MVRINNITMEKEIAEYFKKGYPLTRKTLKKEIQKNLKLVNKGKPLTLPLAVLNGEFKIAYKNKFGDFEKKTEEEIKAARKKAAYYKANYYKYKAHKKAYYQKMKGGIKTQWEK